MESIDHWQICDEFTVVQAALLIAGFDPSIYQEGVESDGPRNRPTGYEAAKNALIHAINAKRLKAIIKFKASGDWGYINYNDLAEYEKVAENQHGRNIIYNTMLDLHLTTILRSDLENWLIQRGKGDNSFFFPKKSVAVLPYLDPNNPNYSFKLAAAIFIWTTLNSDASLMKAKTVKQAAVDLLQEKANLLGLIKEDNKLNSQAVEDISKVVNWRPDGGAPKTPGK